MKRCASLAPALLLLALASGARAICDVVPQPQTSFRGATASTNRVFASEGDVVQLSRDGASCEAGDPGFGTTPASDSVVTLVYRPPEGPATAVVLGSATYCGVVWPLNGYEAACEAQLGAGGTAICDPTGNVSGGADALAFTLRTQGRSGPVKLAVSSAGAGPPCQIATQRCDAQAGLAACIDEFYESDGTCGTASAQRHAQFPGLTALPPPNDFAGICDSPDPSIPCGNGGSDVRFTTDAEGNLVVPIDWVGVLVPGTLPIPRLVRASTSVPAFLGTPPEPAQVPGAPIAVPGLAFLQSFSPKGLRVDPLFNPLFNPNLTDTQLFGSADAERGILRILRRSPSLKQCSAGARVGLPCAANFECPAAQCVPARCRGGTNAGKQCSSDAMCPGGECGSALFDFADRYSAGGTGPILLTSAEYEAEAQNPAAIDGLASTDTLFMFVRSETLESKDLNLDGDQLDQTIVTLRDAATGEEQPIGALPGSAGRASTRMAYRNFRFPTVAVEDDLLAFLEVEPYEGDVDQNGDGDRGDALLRVFRQDPAGPVELTHPLVLHTPDPVPGIDTGPLQISDGLVFVRLSERAGTERTSTTLNSDMSFNVRITPDGRFVVFHSDLALAPTFNTLGGNVWIRDRDVDADGIYDEPGQTLTESVSDRCSLAACTSVTQCPGNFCGGFPDRVTFDVTSDGRYVAFNSSYQNLVANDTNAAPDVFVRDRLTDTTTRVSVSSAGAQATGGDMNHGGVALSDDGRFVAFVSNATISGLTCPLLPGGITNKCIYVRDRTLATTSLVLPVGTVGGGGGTGPTRTVWLLGMSADGRFVGAFDQGSYAGLLVDRDANGNGQYGDQAILPFPGGLLSRDARFILALFASPILRFDRDPLDLQFLDFLGAPAAASLPLPPFPLDIDDDPPKTHLSPDGRFVARILEDDVNSDENVVLSDIDGGIAEVLENDIIDSGFVGPMGVASSEEGLFTVFVDGSGALKVRGVDTSSLSGDLNLDGDVGDVFLAVADARDTVPLSLDLIGPARDVATAGGHAVFLRPESADGAGSDLNGDADSGDDVVHVWRNRQAGPAVNLGLSARRVAMSGRVIAALVSEAGEGTDLNGDGDTNDLVPHVNDLATGTAGTWINLDRAAGSPDLQARGRFVAFVAEEIPGDPGTTCPPHSPPCCPCVPIPPTSVPGGLLIYDTMAEDFVALADAQGTQIDPPLLDDFVLGEEIAAFRANEALTGANLNGVVPPIPGGVADGDQDDSVLHAIDLATGRVYNSMQAAIPCPVEACDPRIPYRIVGRKVTYLTLEAQQGQNDLDQNGDGGIGLVLQHFNVEALAAGGAAEDAQDLLGGTLAGICTGSAEACTGDAGCAGADICYFPPGGCLFDTGASCDPSAPDCDAGEFCAPILGMPGEGTCVEFQGPCLTDGECTAPAFCTDDGADPEQLFASVSAQPDGRQRFVGLGLCSDGDGSCANDGHCNPGTVCDQTTTVLATAPDTDADGLADPIDDCPDVPNGDQLDTDGDGVGDACDRETCGNGLQEYDEGCDHGAQNGLDGLCDAACVYVGAGFACSDGVDNDGDGRTDHSLDQGCTSASDPSERGSTKACDDGIDNDGDYGVDFAAVPGDPGCGTAGSNLENPQCSNGIDDDGDGKVDFDGGGFGAPDPQCTTPSKNKEKPSTCGLGLELVLLVPVLARLARRRARS